VDTATRFLMPSASRITSACSGAGKSSSQATPRHRRPG
jgi:hypothetical protein